MPKPTSEGLNPMQEKFIEEYLHLRNATRAARAAGYAEGAVRQTGSRLLSHPYVKSEIERRLGKAIKKSVVSVEKVLTELAKGAFQELDIGEMKYSDKIKCLELLCKTLGMLDGNAVKERDTGSVQRRLLDALKGIGKGSSH